MYLYNNGKFSFIKTYNEPNDMLITRIKYQAIDGDETNAFKKMNEELFGTKYNFNYNVTRSELLKKYKDLTTKVNETTKILGYVPKNADDIRVSKFHIDIEELIQKYYLVDPVLYDDGSLPPENFYGYFIIHDFDIKEERDIAFLSFLGIERRFNNLKSVCSYLFQLDGLQMIKLIILEPVRRYVLMGKRLYNSNESDSIIHETSYGRNSDISLLPELLHGESISNKINFDNNNISKNNPNKIDFGFPYQRKFYNPQITFDWLKSYTLKISKVYEDSFYYRDKYNKDGNIHFEYQNRIENYPNDPSFEISSYFVDPVRLKCKTNKSNISILDLWEEEKYRLRKIFDLEERRKKLFDIAKERKTAICAPFLPSITKTILLDNIDINNINNKSFRFLDISSGWGDRMLGAIAVGCEYVGFDPNIELKPYHDEMIEMFNENYNYNDRKNSINNYDRKHKNITIYYEPFEKIDEILSPDDLFDIVLSSPPFFNLEIYGTGGQSIELYSEFELWLNKWFLPVITKAFNHLKSGGIMCIHIVDFGKYHIVAPLMIHMKSLDSEILPPYSYGKINLKPLWCWKKN